MARVQQQQMSRKNFRRRFSLLRKWGYACVICGRPFANLACVSIEHVIPQSRLTKNRPLSKFLSDPSDNCAPSHWRCNHVRGTASLLEAVKIIEKKEKSIGNETKFVAWLNTRVPRRNVPEFALIPVIDAEWFMFE